MLLCSEINNEDISKKMNNDNELTQVSEPLQQNNAVILPVIDTTTRPSSVNNQIFATNSVIEELQVSLVYHQLVIDMFSDIRV